MKTNHFLSLFAALAAACSLPAATTLVTDANLADYTGADSISIPAIALTCILGVVSIPLLWAVGKFVDLVWNIPSRVKAKRKA